MLKANIFVIYLMMNISTSLMVRIEVIHGQVIDEENFKLQKIFTNFVAKV